MKTLRKAICQQVEERLGVYGFKKKKGERFIRYADNQVIHTVSFSYSHPNMGHLGLNPVVGVPDFIIASPKS